MLDTATMRASHCPSYDTARVGGVGICDSSCNPRKNHMIFIFKCKSPESDPATPLQQDIDLVWPSLELKSIKAERKPLQNGR